MKPSRWFYSSRSRPSYDGFVQDSFTFNMCKRHISGISVLLTAELMPPTGDCTRENFLRVCPFSLQPSRNFQLDRYPADPTSACPRDIGAERDSLHCGNGSNRVEGETAYVHRNSTLSSGAKLLAIGSTRERILIYNVPSQDLSSYLKAPVLSVGFWEGKMNVYTWQFTHGVARSG
jgi:hypothetical protein